MNKLVIECTYMDCSVKLYSANSSDFGEQTAWASWVGEGESADEYYDAPV